jgi:tetratricopeptide (TPR) repeat protein
MRPKYFLVAWAMVFLARALANAGPDDPCDALMRKAEVLWLGHDFDASDRVLDQARKLCPARPELYWRRARNEFDRIEAIPREKKPGKDELLARYNAMEKLADKCIALDDKDGNCWEWKAVATGRRGTTQDVLNTLPEVDDLEKLLLKAESLKPGYRSADGSADSIGDIDSMLGQFYRALPEWICVFPFKQFVGTCGDLDKSVAYQRKAVAREPQRIEYQKELAISLMCRGQRRDKPEEIEEAKKILRAMDAMPEIKPSDKVDKQHAKMILADPSLACGYSRDAQQEQSPEALKLTP